MGFDHFFENRDSFASQLIRHKARQLVRHPGFRQFEQEDIEQELRKELVQKYSNFDPDRARETTFIARVIENKTVSLVRIRTAEKRDFRRNANSLNETVRDADGGSVERVQTFDTSAARNHTGQSPRSDEEQSQLRLDIAEVLKSLPDELRHLAELLQEMSEYAASRNLGKSRRQVAKDVACLRKLFEDHDLAAYL